VEIDMERNKFRVHFKGFSSKWDEEIDLPKENDEHNSLIDEKYAEIGLYSGAIGYAKFHKDDIKPSDKGEQAPSRFNPN
jgi:hypothetical protein